MTAGRKNREPGAGEASAETRRPGRTLRTVRAADLPDELGAAARAIAERLAGAGFRAWVVGGAVRDLALGLVPSDVDMASAAHPDVVERLFAWTLPVGKAFGTMLVRWPERAEGLEVQVTTFRSEAGYADGRRPDRVEYGSTLEEDAARRDFTCNALFLDPLTDELADPEGGLADLAAGVLRCVGDARERFAEDGLRLLRMARFAAGFGLEPTPEVVAAARRERASLRGVSAERIFGELKAVFKRPNAARALTELARCELLGALVPDPRTSSLGAAGAEEVALRARALDALRQPVGLEAGLAVLFGAVEASAFGSEPALEGLRAPLAVRRNVARLWTLRDELERLDASASRADRVLAFRDELFEPALHLALAWRAARGLASDDLQRLALARARLSRADLFPEPLIVSADLAAGGVERGPRFGALLREAERAQLEGAFADRAGALRWLAERV